VENPPVEKRPQYDPDCYLCPGNRRAGGHRNPGYENTFVFDNDFTAMKPGVGEEAHFNTGESDCPQRAGDLSGGLLFSPA